MTANMITRCLTPTPAHTTAPGRTPRHARMRCGFSLVELVLSMGMMSVLLMGITSAILIASKALPDPKSPVVSQALVTSALDQLNTDLMLATAITEITPTAITVTVADRGHGSSGPETIRWAWSGTAGDPLTRQYNGTGAKTVVPSVSAFALSPEIIPSTLKSPPRVLMVVNSTIIVSPEDTARTEKLTAWGFPYTVISAVDTLANFNAALAACDVVYVTAGTNVGTLLVRLTNPGIGVVTEHPGLYSHLGMASAYASKSDYETKIISNTHPITLGFPLDSSQVLSGYETLHALKDTLAPGLVQLGKGSGDLSILDFQAIRTDGTPARARRVALPWGGTLLDPFAFSSLTGSGRTFLKRSLAWAAAPPVYESVSVNLTAGTAPAAGMRIELLAKPRVPAP